jgi:D-alanyl-lipoteichoic acid acyltransferase DltB (MBOAT superfamily)
LEWAAVIVTFHWVCLGYMFFRAPTVTAAWRQLESLFQSSGNPIGPGFDWKVLVFSGLAVFWQQWHVSKSRNVFWIFECTVWYRVAVYLILGFLLLRFYAPSDRFIYFQF